ncbi:hypothetical protein C1646_774194 [Rhizophagus diaphanus]|nr:hypothetical protein C1646_774194 [Rhizophagus diaphanus] [Rhizophagus sp. MUCL 43196]
MTDDGLDELSEAEPDKDEDNLMINERLELQTPNPKKKQKSKVYITVNKQDKNQLIMAKPDVQTSAKNSQKEKKLSDKLIQILTRYKT